MENMFEQLHGFKFWPVERVFGPPKVRNGLGVMHTLREIQHEGKWDDVYTFTVCRAVIMACLTESQLLMYANQFIPESLNLPHDAVGTDHDSVGLLQQRAAWGTVRDRMNVDKSVRKFLFGVQNVSSGLCPVKTDGTPLFPQIQRVQVSGYSDGSNYLANMPRSFHFMRTYWHTVPHVK